LAALKETVMQLALRPVITAGVALAVASMIAVTPVAPPPLPDVQVPAVQLTSVTDLLGDVPGILGGTESAVAAAASDVSALAGASAPPFVDTLLTTLAVDLNTLITTLGPANGVLYLTLVTLSDIVDLIGGQLGVWPCTLLGCGPPLSATLATASAATDLSALSHVSALPDVSTLLNPADLFGTMLNPGDLTALLNPGDLSTLLNPADFATLFDPAGISSMLSTLAADTPTMLPSLIP
jgi:hypothetical protein